jgi:transcriptional repressor NrdR
MKCPQCGCLDDKVVDSRVQREGEAIRRRRQCLECGHRFTTYEAVILVDKLVVKRDGRREEFSVEKLGEGVSHACWKRPIGEAQIDQVVRKIQARVDDLPGNEIPSREIGEIVMAELQKLDDIAYVRFASVYRRFRDVDQFVNEVRRLSEQQAENRGRDD